MDESDGDKFLRLVDERKKLEKQMRNLAWQITPDYIKELLCGEEGLFVNDNGAGRDWLISPKWQFNHKSPTEVIIDNRIDEVKKLIIKLIHGIY